MNMKLNNKLKLYIAEWIARNTNRATITEGACIRLVASIAGYDVNAINSDEYDKTIREIGIMVHKARANKIAMDTGLLKGKSDGSYND